MDWLSMFRVCLLKPFLERRKEEQKRGVKIAYISRRVRNCWVKVDSAKLQDVSESEIFDISRGREGSMWRQGADGLLLS